MCRPAATSPIPRSIPSSPTSSAFSTRWPTGLRAKTSPAATRSWSGDLNVAPLEHDVWSHKALLKVVSHTPLEVEKFARAVAAGPWVDVLRRFVPAEEKCYTWWSYRSPDWAKANKGRRLDHIWVSEGLRNTIAGMTILKEGRGWDRPSDHVPVIARLDI